ncbi:MAG: CPBP family intramembrane metalloprotease [Saccharofermentans sp.]|nr:CPBP family intramembrane metalloprotease [Saccharofermentans sp.]
MKKKRTPAKIFSITKDAGLNRLIWYLMLVVLLSAFCFITLHVWLLPYSAAYSANGVITPGYLLYAVIGILFSTPGPFVAVLILSLFIERTGLKHMMHNIFRTENKPAAILITSFFCLMALAYALLFGKPNGSPWYMFILGLIVMIPFVGIAEETGWRGILQPELDKRLPFPFSVILTAAIWCVWHFDAWIDPTSRHYNDSFIGFAITILIWSFAMAAIYKATGSVFACAFYHAFIDSIGAVYDWNSLFDSFPGSVSVNVFRAIWLVSSIGLWVLCSHMEHKDSKALSGHD